MIYRWWDTIDTFEKWNSENSSSDIVAEIKLTIISKIENITFI